MSKHEASPEVIETAAVYCSIRASDAEVRSKIGDMDHISFDLDVAHSIAVSARGTALLRFYERGGTTVLPLDETDRELWAEAEAMLRTGWRP